MILEWLNLVVRWFHVIVGIGWIGTSFFFMWLDAHLTPNKSKGEHSGGEIWLIHSGGYYEVEKKRFVPVEVLPALHWFKWEAYLTWLSGFFLLIIVYYLSAGAFLVDPTISNLTQGEAIALGIGTLAISWVIYDLLWSSTLSEKSIFASVISFILLVGVTYALAHLLSGRATYMHVGALLGTLMAANVLFVIQPAQRRMFRANQVGEVPDPAWGKKAKQRSTHNNYMTLPVVFVMLSNHFPNTYGHAYNWEILIVLFLAGAGVQHFLNTHGGGGHAAPWVLAGSVLAVIALALITSSPLRHETTARNVGSELHVTFAQVRTVFTVRCVSCHSARPTDDMFRKAPNGVMFDAPEQIKRLADKIKLRVVDTKTMPLANKTRMTEAERVLIAAWVKEGAPID